MESVVGTWELVSYVTELPDGGVVEPWPDPVGQITYDGAGRMMAMVMSRRRNEADGTVSAADAQSEFTAYFGTYVIDANKGVIRHRISASLQGARAAGELELAGRDLDAIGEAAPLAQLLRRG